MLCHWNHPWSPSIARTCFCVWGKRDQLKICWWCSHQQQRRRISQRRADGAGVGKFRGEGEDREDLWKARTWVSQAVSMVTAISEPKEEMLSQSGEPSGLGLRNQSKDMPCQILRSWEQTRNVWKGKYHILPCIMRTHVFGPNFQEKVSF